MCVFGAQTCAPPPEEARHGLPRLHSRAEHQRSAARLPWPPAHQHQYPQGMLADYAMRAIHHPGLMQHCQKAAEPRARQGDEERGHHVAPPSVGALRSKAAPARNQQGGHQAQHRLNVSHADCHSRQGSSSAPCFRRSQSSCRTGGAPASTEQPVPVGRMLNVGSCLAEPHKVAPFS
ncbi:hypothetical protein NDU88_005837 [Pleurodeles waltl]|uniref:Uncharacterized protein n=1 Tax=Pleurodeles waltl TaxID=8319 RepID=A0AAV7SMS0_PLEWA|nr:hypothetical protein NDU88_005837 [Pleurodeles waltl]